ncbi:MAG: hypothetical protein L6Q98_23500 [Anaerolineae bacterium]|nr:hypothetical protein [Anaerolineae bacterium]NUQ06380.1 hypothetical protein [Anaerolineae bacterium]
MSEKVEVLTLLQPLPVGAPEMVRAADAELSERLNDGWRRIEMSIQATFNHGSGKVEYMRIVTLERSIEGDSLMKQVEAVLNDLDARAEPEAEAERVTVALPGEELPPRRVVTGVIARKPVTEVGYTEALRSGMYTHEEIAQIGNREARGLGMDVFFSRQQARNGRTWQGLLMRLPRKVNV